jgi:hypothetical protein
MAKTEHQLPNEFNSLEDIQEFWETHSSADYWDEMHDVDLDLAPALQSRLELKKLYRLLGLSPEQVEHIEAKAKQQQTDSRRLISRWVLEHI